MQREDGMDGVDAEVRPLSSPGTAAAARDRAVAGPLRHGNRRGDPNLAPRCGAQTRGGCVCRAPAMANGRCRMHGGTSTGVRSEAGRARIRAARTVHGGYGAAAQAALHQFDGLMQELRVALRLLDTGDEAGALAVLEGTPHAT